MNFGSVRRFLEDPNDDAWASFVVKWLGVSLALHLVTAVFSVGHHSADEYFQILEFLNFKLGRTPLDDLAIEFAEGMRPWLQPGIYYVMAKAWLALGWDQPFQWAVSFRLFAGFAGWLSTVGMALCVPLWIREKSLRRFAILALALIWFFPALHVRPSSESLAGSSFLIAVALMELGRYSEKCRIFLKNWVFWLVAGMALGLSFESRFQMGFMIAGAGLWALAVARAGRTNLFAMGAGFLLVFALGRFVDAWGYGRWVWSPWNYLSYNLIRGEVNRYQHAPWWDFLRMSFTESWPFLGLVVAVATLVAWVRQPLHVLSLSQVPFFVVHELIAHKELRFFFPIAMAAPILLPLALEGGQGWLRRIPPLRWFWYFLLVNNFVALAALCVVPFSRNVQFYEYLAKMRAHEGGPSLVLFTRERDPFEVLGSNIHYYRVRGVDVRKISDWSEVQAALYLTGSAWIFEPRMRLPEDASDLRERCRKVYSTLPEQIAWVNFGNWVERAQVWSLFRCQ